MEGRPPSRRDILAYARRWRESHNKRRERAGPIVERIENRLPDVAQALADEFGATRVVLFGSYARRTAVAASDIDLLVYGIPLRQIVAATVKVSGMLGGVRADVVPAELVEPVIRDRAEADGRILFERAR